ncbi:MAG TPA: maleylpyruvate isomerase family mycothiol-dependent enzyme [Acidimicrobiales bacterium]|nr:maleylpyruvate isomerase family mycothiol-dependent enzyme [Acidimicrobiales bacterium]
MLILSGSGGLVRAAEVWEVVHQERRALAADLAALTADQWRVQSLCSEWTIAEALVHMTATSKITPVSFFPKLAAAGFRLERLQVKDIAGNAGRTPAESLANFAQIVCSTKHPPGPLATMLGETFVHAEDIRRPLGIPHEYPAKASVELADHFKRSNLIIGAKRRISGVSLIATDVDWQHGAGPEVVGPIISLVMAMCGRKIALRDLSGGGVALMGTRP